MKSSIKVIILSFNTKIKLEKCLAPLYACSNIDQMNILVVDNGSKDDSTKMVKDKFRDVKLIESGKNLGFSKANNMGLRNLKEDYALLLNSDAYVNTDAIDKMLTYMNENANVGICGPKALNMDGSLQYSCRLFPNIVTSAIHSLIGLVIKNNRFSAKYRMENVDHNHTMTVDWVSGLCMLIGKEALEKVGIFDEDYFFYMEDVDLCRRMGLVGLKVVYKHDAIVFHETNASGGRTSDLMIKAHHDGMWVYNKKFTKGIRCLWLPFIWLSIRIRKSILIALNKTKK